MILRSISKAESVGGVNNNFLLTPSRFCSLYAQAAGRGIGRFCEGGYDGRKNRWSFCGVAELTALCLALLYAGGMPAQSQPSSSTGKKAPAPAVSSSPINDEELAATREQLLKLLRMSPKLTTVTARDLSLLGTGFLYLRSSFKDGAPLLVFAPWRLCRGLDLSFPRVSPGRWLGI